MQVELEKAAAAAEKRRMAEQEKAKLAAEKAKEIELAKAAAAEQVRAVPAENASTKRRATDEAAEEDAAKSAAAKQCSGNDSQKLASLGESSNTALSPTELITSTQLELRRVGCLSALANGEWGIASQRSLALFNKYAGTQFDAKLAS